MSTERLESAKYVESHDSTGPTQFSRLPMLGAVLVLAVSGFAIWKCCGQTDYVSASAIALITFGALNGFRRGIIGMVISLFAFAAAFHFAPQFGLAFEDAFSEEVGTTGLLNRVLTVAAAGVVTYFAFNLVSSIVLRVLLGRPKGKGVNNGLGFLAGGLQSAAAVLFFLGGFLILEPTLPDQIVRTANDQVSEKEAAEEEAASALTPGEPAFDPNQAMAVFRQQINDTQLRPWVEKYNPFVRIPQLNTFEQVKMTVDALSDPKQVRRILLHPSIKELQEQPETKEALLLMVKDPEVSGLLKSKNRLDKTAIQKLLQNEAVLNLLDRPGFLERAHKVITEAAADAATL